MYAAFGRGDVRATLAQLDSEVSWEFEAPAELSFGGMRRGPGEVTGFFEGIAKDHLDPKLEAQHYMTHGDNVAMFGRYEATLKANGKRVSTPLAHFWTFRDGKVVRYVNYINTAAFLPA